MPADSISNAFFPVLSYSSDSGFMGGGIYSRYDYTGGVLPYRSYLQSTAVISTKGFVKFEAAYEKVGTFGSDIRSTTELFFNRITYNNYFGIGNSTTFDKQLWEDEYYFFETLSGGAAFRGRKPLYRRGASSFDLFAGIGLEYHISYERMSSSSYANFTPNGSKGGWTTLLETGFVWENRNSEFNPTSGNRVELEVRHAPFFLSRYEFTTLKLDVRKYVNLFDRLTLALRAEGRHAGGDVPFWEFSTLGDQGRLRGYPLNRFQGNSAISVNAELRTWFLHFPEYTAKIGVQLFTDAGRVFTAGDDAGDLLRGYKQTFGIGGALSVYNPDFILRGDLGFSEDVARIYVGIGYLF